MAGIFTVQEELKWLADNPAFEERPASMDEFLGPEYLNVEGKIREAIRRELRVIMGDEPNGYRPTAVQYAMLTGAIGIGKTTIASLVLSYLVHWVLCLRDPQDFYGLMPGSRIAFMQMSTSEDQAREVIFGDIEARIRYSPWFQNSYPRDPTIKRQIRFPKDVWIIPGDSSETTFEGYNILGGILDEADSHKETENKDYAEQGYNTIDSRMTSRFQDRGFLMVIGQMKKSMGFAQRKFDEFCQREDAYAYRMTIWDSMGERFYDDKPAGPRAGKWFSYDTQRKLILPPGVAEVKNSDTIIKVPELYRIQFENDPEKALRDLAGIPPIVGDAFITLVDRVTSARDRWITRYGDQATVDPMGRIEPWFQANGDPLKRVCHIDIGYSANGDALGFAMGHVREMVEVFDESTNSTEIKPYIVIDMLLRMQAAPGSEIFIADIRRVIYELKQARGFKIARVSMDGFESTETRQQLERRRFEVETVSCDKQKAPYEDLREAIYEERIEFPPYITRVRKKERYVETEILVKELLELVDAGRKIDHPVGGSKDVADAVAGVVYGLMGDRRYHRKVVSLSTYKEERSLKGRPLLHHPALLGDGGDLRAPLPPSDWSNLP